MNNKFIFPEKLIKYEVHEFMRFDRFTYDLPVDVFVDICGECIYNEHLLVIYFRNSYDREDMNFAPMSVDDNPTVLCDKTINLYNKDIIRLKLWVKKYRAYIKGIDEKKCTWKHLYNVAAKNYKEISKYIVESINAVDLPIYEMAVIDPEISGLNWKVWLDDSKAYKDGGHAMRIKVQNLRKDERTRTWNPIMLHNSQFIDDVKDKYNYSDRCSFAKFIDANYDIIMDLADMKINLAEFLNRLRKVYKISGSKWEAEPSKENKEPEYKFVYDLKNGYELMYSAEFAGYNVMNPDGELMMDEWVYNVDYRELYDNVNGKKMRYFLIYTIDNETYKLYADNRLLKL